MLMTDVKKLPSPLNDWLPPACFCVCVLFVCIKLNGFLLFFVFLSWIYILLKYLFQKFGVSKISLFFFLNRIHAKKCIHNSFLNLIGWEVFLAMWFSFSIATGSFFVCFSHRTKLLILLFLSHNSFFQVKTNKTKKLFRYALYS